MEDRDVKAPRGCAMGLPSELLYYKRFCLDIAHRTTYRGVIIKERFIIIIKAFILLSRI